jgi:hypothetical protein
VDIDHTVAGLTNKRGVGLPMGFESFDAAIDVPNFDGTSRIPCGYGVGMQKFYCLWLQDCSILAIAAGTVTSGCLSPRRWREEAELRRVPAPKPKSKFTTSTSCCITIALFSVHSSLAREKKRLPPSHFHKHIPSDSHPLTPSKKR